MEQEFNNRAQSSFPNRLGSEKKAMHMVEPFFEESGFSKVRLEDIKTLVSEACLNAIEHGNAMDENLTYEVELLIRQHDVFIIRVYDQGGVNRWRGLPQFLPISSIMNTENETRGWGLQIIDSLADEWEFHISEDRTCLEIRVKL